MSIPIDKLRDDGCHAIVTKQKLRTVTGVVVAPATYAVTEDKTKQTDTYWDRVSWIPTHDPDVRDVVLDSAASQNNRFEQYCIENELVPLIPVEIADEIRGDFTSVGSDRRFVADLPHRCADTLVQASELGDRFRAAMEEFRCGDPRALVRLDPFSVLLGFDGRLLNPPMKAPKTVVAKVTARACRIFVEPGQFVAAFRHSGEGLPEKPSVYGLAEAPHQQTLRVTYDTIDRDAVFTPATVLRAFRAGPDLTSSPEAEYLLLLGLLAVVRPVKSHDYRVGCTLVPAGRPETAMIHGESAESVVMPFDVAAIESRIRELLVEIKAPVSECRVTAESFKKFLDVRSGKAAAKKKKSRK